MEDANLLRTEVSQFAQIDDQIKQLNKQIALLREQRSTITDRIGVLLATPQFVSFNKLSVSADGSHIKVSRPAQTEKPWSLSLNTLRKLLNDYFETPQPHSSNEAFRYIYQQNRKFATTFSLDRVVPAGV